MDLGINDKSVLVVGASKGIGREIAVSFAKEGCNKLVCVARSENLLLELVKECSTFKVKEVFYKAVDLMACDAESYAQQLDKEFGPFDIVIQNIGTSLMPREPVTRYADWEYALRLNAGIAINLNSIFIPIMKAKGWGRIIHTSSISAKMLRGNPLYASSKAFLNAYVITTGRHLASTGVALMAVEPGAVSFSGSYWDNALLDNDPKCEDFLRHHQAIGRFGTCKEIADVVLFLSSTRTSFMPGAIVAVDGANM